MTLLDEFGEKMVDVETAASPTVGPFPVAVPVDSSGVAFPALPARHVPISATFRLVLRITEAAKLDARRLRVLEYLVYRSLTAPASDRTSRLPRPIEEMNLMLSRLPLKPSTEQTVAATRRYSKLAEEALSTLTWEELERGDVLKRVRSVKYALRDQYLNLEVLRTAVHTLSLIERLRIEHLRESLKGLQAPATVRTRLPNEQPDNAPTSDANNEISYDNIVRTVTNVRERRFPTGHPFEEGILLEFDDDDTGLEGKRVAYAAFETIDDMSPEKLEQEPSGLPLPVSGSGPERFYLATGAMADFSGETITLVTTRLPRRSSVRGRSTGAPTLAARQEVWSRPWRWFWGLCLSGSLAFSLFAGLQLLSLAPLPELDGSGVYQAYSLEGETVQRYLKDARRVDETLIITANESWPELTLPESSVLVEQVVAQMLGKDGIKRLLIIDRSGNRLAIAPDDGVNTGTPDNSSIRGSTAGG